MSEQDKRAVYMGTFERFKREVQVKHEDVILQLSSIKTLMKYSVILGGAALGVALVALAI